MSDRPAPIDLDLWERVLAGGGTAEEQKRVRAWVRSVAGDPPVEDQLRAAVRALESAAGVPVVDPVAFARAVIARTHPRSPRATHRWRELAAAAAVLVALATGIGIGSLRRQRAGELRRYATAPGGRLNVTLADGTTISLAPATRLDVPSDYAAGDRTVRLDGEAVFDVVHNAQHPFRVRAGHITLTDVGTRFDVRAYATDRAIRAAVIDGSVALSGATLVPGDVATVDSTDALFIHHVGDVAAFTAWQSGRLVFRDATLAEVARTLSRWYAADVQVADTLIGRRTLTASYTNLTLDHVLSLISHASDAKIARRGRTIVLW